MPLSVAILNVQSGVETTRGYWQYAIDAWKYFLPHAPHALTRAGDFLRNERVDVALCTEVTEPSLRSGFRSHTGELTRSSGLAHHHFFSAMRNTFAHEGSAIFSRYPISGSWTHPLAGPASQRVLGDTIVHTGAGDVRFFVAHLALRTRLRHRQIAQVAHLVADTTEPCVLGGDFNETDDRAFSALTEAGFEMYSLPSYPSWAPSRKLIRLFVRGLRVEALRIPQSAPFSDHAPLLATLKVA